MTWRTAQLEDVATVVRGVSFDKSEVSTSPADGYIPILRAGNIEDDLNVAEDLVWVPESRVSEEQRLRVGDIAICMSSGSQSVVGKTASLKRAWIGSVGAFCAVIRPTDIDPDFLAFFLKSDAFRKWTRQASGASIKNIRKSELEAFEIPIPPHDKQRCIADVLSRAEGIVRLRHEARAKASELVPALFLDMFGDPASNPRGWPVVELGDLIVGGPQNGLYKHKSFYGEGTPILRIDGFYDGAVRDLALLQRVRIEPDEIGRYGLVTGDIVINRVNSPEYLGKTALIPQLREPTVFESNMMRFRLDVNRTVSRFIIQVLQTGDLRKQILANAKHAINQSSINQQDVKGLRFPLPPVDLQHKFATKADAVRAIQAQQDVALEKAQANFDALLQRFLKA